MHLILKDTEKANEKVQQLIELYPFSRVQRLPTCTIVETAKVVCCVVQFPERRVKVWRSDVEHSENSPIYLHFQDLVSIQDL